MKVEYVEVRGKTVDVAVAAAMQELRVDDRERIDVEVVQQPERGFLGFGGQDAVVRVSLKDQQGKRRRRRRKRKPDSEGGADGDRHQERSSGPGARRPDAPGGDRGPGGGGRGGRGERERQSGGDRGGSRQRDSGQRGGSSGGGRRERSDDQREEKQVAIEEQVPVVEEFLTGLVG
jgi:predicted RNA-binding protein Jag